MGNLCISLSRPVIMFARSVARASAQASASGLVATPIQVFGLSGRYATALYSAASKKNVLDKVEKDLVSFRSKMNTDANLKQLCSNAPVAIKKTLPQDSLKNQGTDITQSFVDLLVQNNRLDKAGGIIDSFLQLMAAHRGEVRATIVSARPLPSQTVAQIRKSLEGNLERGKKLIVETQVKPEIMGGLMVTMGEKHIDLSVKSKLSNLSAALRAPI